VLIDGVSVGGRRVADLARIVGLAFQDPDRQLRGSALARAIDRSLEMVGLAEEARTNPYDLGRSRRRLLAIASVVAMGTPVVVLDEPTIGLDSHQRAVVGAVVQRLAGEGRTVVGISHDAGFVAASFERVVRLDAGRVVADGPAAAPPG
jgi:energy-coupling factor transport system ATP-binding protein